MNSLGPCRLLGGLRAGRLIFEHDSSSYRQRVYQALRRLLGLPDEVEGQSRTGRTHRRRPLRVPRDAQELELSRCLTDFRSY